MQKTFAEVMKESENQKDSGDYDLPQVNDNDFLDNQPSNHYHDFNESNVPEEKKALSRREEEILSDEEVVVDKEHNYNEHIQTQKMNSLPKHNQTDYLSYTENNGNFNQDHHSKTMGNFSPNDDDRESGNFFQYKDERPFEEDERENNRYNKREEVEEIVEEEEDTEEINYINNIKASLKKLFNFYASFGNRLSNNKMKCSQFIKLATDANIIDNKVDVKTIELDFIYVNSSQMNLEYENFIKLLHYIGQQKYGNEDSNENFKELLEKNMIPLFKVVYEETDLGTEDKILKSKIGFATLMLLHLRKDIYFAMYVKYFKFEKNKTFAAKRKIMRDKSKKALLQFLRDFELLPGLLNMSIINNFFTEIMAIEIENPQLDSINDLLKVIESDCGLCFTYIKFLFFLSKISLYIFSDPNNIPRDFKETKFTGDEKFYMLLERLEISQGFFDLGFAKKTKNNEMRLALSNKELADMHKETNAFPNFEDYIDEHNESIWMMVNFDFEFRKKRQKPLLYQKLYREEKTIKQPKRKKSVSTIKFDKRFLNAIEKYKADFKKVFMQYSQNHDNKAPQMNCFKFIKFLKDIKTVRTDINNRTRKDDLEEDEFSIDAKEADLIFGSLTHSNKQKSKRFLFAKNREREQAVKIKKTIGFQKFLKAIEIIIEKIYDDEIEKAVENFYYIKLARHLLSNNKDLTQSRRQEPKLNQTLPMATEKIYMCNKYLQRLAVLLSEDGLVEMLDTVHKCVYKLFECYANNPDYIGAKDFFDLFSDFDIFPEIIKKIKLETIFDALVHVFNDNNEKDSGSHSNVIDQHLFVEAFILIADDLKFNFDESPTIFQKITFLLDIMNESDGFTKVLKRNPAMKRYNIIQKIKEKYPDFFLI